MRPDVFDARPRASRLVRHLPTPGAGSPLSLRTIPMPARTPTRAEMTPITATATIATGTSERSSARSPSRASSRRCRSTAISCRISSAPRSAISAQRLERPFRLLDRLSRLGRRGLLCGAHRQEAEEPGDEEDRACDDEQREPEGKGLRQTCRRGCEGEPDGVDDEDCGPQRETSRKTQRSRPLFPLELRELDVQSSERSKLPPHGVHLRKHAKHEGSLLHCFPGRDADRRQEE